MRSRFILEGVGAALMLLFYYRGLMEPSNLALFFHGLPVAHLIGGFLVDVLAFAILVALLLSALEYLPPIPRKALQALFAGLMLWRIVDLAVALQTINWLTADWQGVRKQSLIGIALVLVVFVLLFPRVGLPVVRAVRLVVAGSAFCALWIVPQLIHIALIRPPENGSASAHLSDTAYIGSDRRIIWILFDELSYDQTFDHPFPGIDLPNFRRLRSESVSYSKLEPAGFHTQEILSLIHILIRMRAIEGDAVREYRVNGREFQVIDIPPGFTHSITNVGHGEMVTLFWASEVFDPNRPDTYYLPVCEEDFATCAAS